MTTIATGLVDTETVLADERVVDMNEEIAMLDPDTTQFTTMLMQLGSKPAVREKINWLEDELFPRLSGLAASATSAATTLTVTTNQGAYFRARDLVRNANTGEMYLVTSISTDTLTVTRAIGAVAAASSASGVDLVITGNAAVQGATLGTRHITKKVLGYNYEQTQRDPFGFTDIEAKIKTYGGPAPDHEEVKKLVEHKRAMELGCFLGARSFTAAAPNSWGSAGGAVEYISTNSHNAAGALSHSLFDSYLQADLQHGSKNKVLFASPLMARAISGFLKTAYAPTQVDGRKFGAKVDSYISGAYGWEVPVVVKRDWQDFASTNTGYGGWGFLIDMDYVQLRVLEPTELLRNRQANDATEQTHEYRTTWSLEFRQEKCHAVYKGITG